jgi:hypothetical protein
MTIDMKQLSTTFGKIRLTEIEGIEYGSVYDALKFLGLKNPRSMYKWIHSKFPEVVHTVYNFKFKGRGQRETPIARLQTLLQLCAKTKEGSEIDHAAFETLNNLLTAPEKLVQQVDEIHGSKGVRRVKREADYLDGFHSLGDTIKDHTLEDHRGKMIGSVHKHNNKAVGLPDKKGRDSMTNEQQSALTAIQHIEALRLSKTDRMNWDAVKLCKQTANNVIKLIGT